LSRIHVLQVHKIQHKPINIQVRDPIQKEQKELECALVWRTGLSGVPPDSVRCTMPVQIRSSHSRKNAGALCCNSPDCPVSQWSNDYLRSTVDSDSSTMKHRSQSSESEGHRTIRYTTRLSGATRRQRRQWSTAPEP
jgi:hypothetical protein